MDNRKFYLWLCKGSLCRTHKWFCVLDIAIPYLTQMRSEEYEWLNDVRFWDEAGEPNAGPPGGNSEYNDGNWNENEGEYGGENGCDNVDEGYVGCVICEWDVRGRVMGVMELDMDE